MREVEATGDTILAIGTTQPIDHLELLFMSEDIPRKMELMSLLITAQHPITPKPIIGPRMETIDVICRFFGCRPGDLLEQVKG